MAEDKKVTNKNERLEDKKDSNFIIVLTLFIVFMCILPNCDGPKKNKSQPVPKTQIEKTTKKTTTNTIKQQPQVKPINTTTPTKKTTSPTTTTKYSDYDNYYDDTWYIYEGEEGREYHLDDEE